jgi:hypothetical protein
MQISMTNCCEQGKQPSDSIKDEDYLNELNVYQILKMKSAQEISWFPARQIDCEGIIWMELS